MKVIRLGSRLSLRVRPRALTTSVVCTVVAVLVALYSIGHADYPMSVGEVLDVIAGGGTPTQDFMVNEVRLPRVIGALAVGAAFALSGAVFQSLVRNPLGSPDLLGFTQGAATGALLVIVAGGSSLALAGGAIGGGLLTGAVVYALAWRHGVGGYRLLLVGIGMSAMLTGVNGYLLTRGRLDDAARAVLWLTGSMDGRGWSQVAPVLVALGVLGPVVVLGCGRALRAVEMGDDTAAGLGVPVERIRLTVLAGAVVLIAFAAATAGPVSFVALTAPQVAKRLTRAPGPNLVPAACVGAVLLVSADWLAQTAFAERQLPVGVVTGLLGGGYLVWLLAGRRKAGLI